MSPESREAATIHILVFKSKVKKHLKTKYYSLGFIDVYLFNMYIYFNPETKTIAKCKNKTLVKFDIRTIMLLL